MGNKYQKNLKKKGIVTNSRGGKDAALDAAIKNIYKDPEMKDSWGFGTHMQVNNVNDEDKDQKRRARTG